MSKYVFTKAKCFNPNNMGPLSGQYSNEIENGSTQTAGIPTGSRLVYIKYKIHT
jgi:hypothetical protein